MDTVIDLNEPTHLPDVLYSKLKEIDYLCGEYEFSERLLEHERVQPLVTEINDYCLMSKIIGIHYTRAIPNELMRHGLLVRSGDEIRKKFLNDHSPIFTAHELSVIESRWRDYFSQSQQHSRDGKLWFNFTREALETGGAEYLLGLYGGEQVSMCFRSDASIGKKLSSIGEPLIVKCSLDPNDVTTFIQEPWGKILVSSYHLSLNAAVYRIDLDGYQTVPVLPANIELERL